MKLRLFSIRAAAARQLAARTGVAVAHVSGYTCRADIRARDLLCFARFAWQLGVSVAVDRG